MSESVQVTVLLAAHNRLQLLKDSIASALAQDAKGLEVLVVDDGSEAATQRWLEGECARYPNLRVLRQERLGVALARQNGLIAARGRYICILDSDDLLAQGAISRILEEFNRNPDIDLIYTNNTHLLPDGSKKVYALPAYENNAAMIRAMFLRPRLPVKHSGTTYRREDALALGGYSPNLPIKIDIDFFLKYLAAGKKLYLLKEPLVTFRMHRDSISANRMLGIRVYWWLADKYGPRNSMIRLYWKAVRTGIELAKLIYWKRF